MPGITGFISAGPAEARGECAERMVGAMSNESFCRSGVLRHDASQVAVGWVVHEGSFAAQNPYWNAAGTVGLVFFGEEFADAQTMAPIASGSSASHSAQRLLAHYEQVGLDRFLIELNGTFCGLLIDLRQARLHLFNDRFGLGRLYVHETRDGLLFASEAKSILRVAPQTRELDPRGLAEFAACGCALGNRTLFKGITLLPAASCWTFAGGKLVDRRAYFDTGAWSTAPRMREDEYHEALKATFTRVVPKYLRGDQKVGMSLTGGLDGRMIMACSTQSAGTLPCYTFGGPYRECRDVTLARRIAEACGQPHEVISVGDTFMQQFRDLAPRCVFLSDGAMDVTGAVELYVNRLARQIAPVRLTGNYGSEILRSNVAFKAQPLDPLLFNDELLGAGETAGVTYANLNTGRALDLVTRYQVPWHHCSRLGIEQSQLTMRSPYLDNDLVALAYRAPPGMESAKSPALRFVHEAAPAIGRIPTDRGLLHQPLPALTRLHHAYQEFSVRAEYAYDYGMPQWLTRIDASLRGLHLERLFLGRHKFYHFRVWYRDKLGAYLREVLLDPRSKTRPYLRSGNLEKLIDEHLAGTRNHTSTLHQALSLELIHRELLERAWN
jgi:asparagine synthase (glutamine-hydrolysing)